MNTSTQSQSQPLPQAPPQDRMADEAANIKDFDKKSYAVEVKVATGTSATVRLLDGSNAFEKCSVSWFFCDDDKIRPFTIENSHEGQGALARLIGDSSNYYKGGYLESQKGQFGKVNIHQVKDLELFKRLTEYYNSGYSGLGSIAFGDGAEKDEGVQCVLHFEVKE